MNAAGNGATLRVQPTDARNASLYEIEQMRSGVRFSRVWHDDDMVELRIEVADRTSSFVTTACTTAAELLRIHESLLGYREEFTGGAVELRFGEFGPQRGNGAFHARLQFQPPGSLFVCTHQQSGFLPFPSDMVANEARMHVLSEPVLLDRFIHQLQGLATGQCEEAVLDGLEGGFDLL